jgi:hypothetical protein
MSALTKALQNFFQSKDSMIEDLKLPYTKHPNLPHSFIKLNRFYNIANTRWRATIVLWTQKWSFQCVCEIRPLYSTKCSVINVITLIIYETVFQVTGYLMKTS